MSPVVAVLYDVLRGDFIVSYSPVDESASLTSQHIIFIVGECILLRMYQISKYRQPSSATVLQRALLYTYITTCLG
jgi:hypothetical protein